ncbi:MAG: ABC transporter permease [Thermomicrobiales bacterium]
MSATATQPAGIASAASPALPRLGERTRSGSNSWRKYVGIAIPGGVLAIVVLLTIFASVIAPFDPNKVDMRNALSGPSSDHWLGTDQLGRDQLSRLLYGGRSTLMLSVLAMLAISSIGAVIGITIGYFGGKIDLLISAFLTMLLSLPSLLLTLAILGVMGPGTTSLLVALIGAGWVGHARILRSSVLSLREQVYVEAAVSSGASTARVLARHILPNLLTQVIILATLDIGALILTISSLSFLGLGVQPPTPDWGTMLNDARPYFSAVPLLVIIPGVTIAVIVLCGNLLGDAIRDLADVGHRNR